MRQKGHISEVMAQSVLEVLEALYLLMCSIRYACAFDDFHPLSFAIVSERQLHDLEDAVNRLGVDELRLLLHPEWRHQSKFFALASQALNILVELLKWPIVNADEDELTPATLFYPALISTVCRNVKELPLPERRPWGSLQSPKVGQRVELSAPFMYMEGIHHLAAQVHELRNVIVNLGAHDGTCMVGNVQVDIANCAFDNGLRGFAIEGNPEASKSLVGKWPLVEVHQGFVSPEEASAAIAAYLKLIGEATIDILKVDVDHADCDFVETILASSLPLPAVLVVEYNPIMPPPIRYRERFSQDQLERFGAASDTAREAISARNGHHWVGCSLQAWQDVVSSAGPGYSALQIELGDIVFVRNDIAAKAMVQELPAKFAVLASQLDFQKSLQAGNGDLFAEWARAYHCRVPSRRLLGMQAYSELDFRLLAELDARDRCWLAKEWWRQERADAFSEMYC
eukprot:TRINITY_DN13781_c0_g1_i7.p1 TRINITY_DN13781_c0_g1~~TRINITY_DN13781_c0_g1_i7.p1  ORF type:complete len:456 (-),score=72.11 TRINITY_DN13781_c0_g1_i7:225-1592(-)